MYKLFAKRVMVYILSLSMLGVGMPSSAGVIGTQTLLDAEQSTGSLERVEAFLARDRVHDQMIAFGVDPQEVQQRHVRDGVAVCAVRELDFVAVGSDFAHLT